MDSDNKLPEPHLIMLHNYDAHWRIIIMERYRSGHNGADSKSVCAKAHEGSNPSLSAIAKDAKGVLFAMAEREGFEPSHINISKQLNKSKKIPRLSSGEFSFNYFIIYVPSAVQMI